MINRADSNKSISSEFRNLNDYDSDILPHSKGFMFGVTFTNQFSVPIPLDPSYFTLQFIQGYQTFTGSSIILNEIDLGYEICDIERDFPSYTGNLDKAKFVNAYCPKNKDFIIAGNFGADNYKFVSVRVIK